MGVLSEIALLPLAPLRGVTWLAEQLRDEAVRELAQKQDLPTQLAELDRQRASGEVTSEEADAREEQLIEALLSEASDRRSP